MLLTGSIVLAEPPVLTPIEDYRDYLTPGNDPLLLDDVQMPPSGFTRLLYIDALAARGNDIFVADTSQRAIFHIDRLQQRINRFAALEGGIGTDLYFASDFSLYVIDRALGRIIQYSRDGRLIRTFGDDASLSAPVAVTEAGNSGRVLVADQVAGQVAEFNRLGGLSRIIGQNINVPAPASSIVDMVSEGDFIYLLDQLARQVVMMDFEGRVLYSIGNTQLKNPVAMAIDTCRRIYVADQFDNSIHVFMDDEPVTVFENNRPGLGYQQITDIWIDQNQLFVADGVTAYIKVFLIEGGCL